jgi:hypothetical protein
MNSGQLNVHSEQALPLKREIYTSRSGFMFITPAVQLALKNGNLLELELSNFKIQIKDEQTIVRIDSNGSTYLVGGAVTKTSSLALRYEFNYRLVKSMKKAYPEPFIGLCLQPYYYRMVIVPHLSNSFPNRKSVIGNQVLLIPRIQYPLNDKWCVDLNVPIAVLDLYQTWQRVDNPLFNAGQRRQNQFDMLFFPRQLQVRLGLGLLI